MVRTAHLVAMWALVGMVWFAAPARAQHSTMSMSIFNDQTTFAPELSRADLEVFTRVLSLKDAERQAMEDLYSAYGATLKAEGADVKKFVAEKMEEAELLEDQRLLDPAQKRLTEWSKRSEQLKKAFMDDLKALLTRDQEGRWPIVERELRRIKWTGGGRLAGENIDLIALVGRMPPESKTSTTLGELLERYSQDLDRALLARADYIDKNGEKFSGLIATDPEAARKMYEGSLSVRRALCDVNARYVRLIGDELSPDARQKLQQDVFKLSFPALTRPTRAERYLKAAKELKSLSPEQRETVATILAGYDNDRQALLARAADALREYQFTELPPSLAKALGMVGPEESEGFRAQGLAKDHPLSRLRRERYDLDKAARAKLDAVLTAAQRDELPDRASEAVTFYDYSPQGL